MKITRKVLFKIVLATAFFICLLEMPYGYYQMVRMMALIGFSLLAYWSYEQNDMTAAIIYAALAILFQPIVKIALGRDLWNFVDVLVSIGLLASIYWERKN
ncbi:MAG TPA: DUF6804 family protein [Saprospiraceae bacterium]|nr:DUF6804 family protein [Saprospiraceae bacterium]